MAKAKKNDGKNGFLITFLALAVIATTLALLFPYMAGGKLSSDIMSIPTVKTNIISKDGESHNIAAEFSVELDKKARSKIKASSIQSSIMGIFQTLDYDKMTGENGDEYIKESVLKELETYIPKEDLKGLYLTDFQRDGLVVPDVETAPDRTRTERLKGLFESIE